MEDYRQYKKQQEQNTARNELLQGQTNNQGYPPQPQGNYGGYQGNYGGYPSQGNYGNYSGGYQQQQGEEDVESIKDQIRTVKQDSANSTQRSLQMIQQAEETAAHTLNKLGEQSQRMEHTERQLDLAEAHSERAKQQAAKLKKINGTMFGFDLNPFSKSREKKDMERVAALEAQQRLSDDHANYNSQQRINEALRTSSGQSSQGYQSGRSTNRSRYQFEEDEEDNKLEDQIDNNLDAISGGLDRLHAMAKASGEEVKRQNQILDRVSDKTDKLGGDIDANTRILKSIK